MLAVPIANLRPMRSVAAHSAKLGQAVRLKVVSVVFPLVVVAFLTVMGAAWWLVTSSFNQVEEVLQHRRVTLALSSELSGITELLARLVRAYAISGGYAPLSLSAKKLSGPGKTLSARG